MATLGPSSLAISRHAVLTITRQLPRCHGSARRGELLLLELPLPRRSDVVTRGRGERGRRVASGRGGGGKGLINGESRGEVPLAGSVRGRGDRGGGREWQGRECDVEEIVDRVGGVFFAALAGLLHCA